MSRTHAKRLSRLEGNTQSPNVTVAIIRQLTDPVSGKPLGDKEPIPSEATVTAAVRKAAERGETFVIFRGDQLCEDKWGGSDIRATQELGEILRNGSYADRTFIMPEGNYPHTGDADAA